MVKGYTIWNGTGVVPKSNKLDVCWGDSTGIVWSSNPYCWDDVFLVRKIAGGADDTYNKWKPSYDQLTDKEKDRFITLVCHVEGHEKTKENKKKIKANISAKQIKLTVEEVLKTQLKLIK